MIVTIDGPAGAGKSTVSRRLAGILGYVYLDTGAMYRAVAWAMSLEGVDCDDEEAVSRALPCLPLEFNLSGGALRITHGGRVLGDELRGPDVTRWSSRVSRYRAVRSFLTGWQRRLGALGNLVAEGRDMGSVVFPEAEAKVFLTASVETRARRRFEEYLEKGLHVESSVLEKQIRDRDHADASRELAPLRPADGAELVDTSEMGIEDVLKRLAEYVQSCSRGSGS